MGIKKILYVHHGKGLGGAPLSLLYLIENLDKTKYYPVVLFLQDSEVVDLYKSKGIEVVGPLNIGDFPHTKIRWFRWYHMHLFLKSCFDTFKTLKTVAPYWFEKIKPDIVHLNTSSLIAWARIAYKKNIPVIWHIREPLADGYFGLRKKFIQKNVAKFATKIVPICQNDAKPWIGNPKVNVIYNAVDSKMFDKDMFVSSGPHTSTGSARAGLSKALNKKPARPELVEGSNRAGLDQVHAVDVSGDLSGEVLTKSEGSERAGFILFLGGLSQEKGTLEIFKILKKLLNLLPETKLLVAGYFDLSTKKRLNIKRYFPAEQYKIKVQKVLNKIKNSVEFLGPIQNVPEMMAKSDMVVFPATVGHFARPIIEAGFMAKPVVASNLSPLNELIIYGQTGFLIDIKNHDIWVEKLLSLLTNKKLNEQMGIKAYEFCIKNFDIKKQITEIEKIYTAILRTR